MKNEDKKISILIPNTNSFLIKEIITRIKKQTLDFSAIEVLIIGEDKPKLVVEDDLVRFIPTDPSSSYASQKRNIGIKEARGHIFLFLDDDCLPAPNWLNTI